MMAGVPMIVSDIGSLLEVTGDGRYASVFRTGDDVDLSERMISLALDPKRRASLAAAAQKWAHEQFGIETHLRNLRALYEELLTKE